MGDRHIPIIDEDKLDDIITALQALSAPSATNVAVDPTGMDIITAENAQGALKQLDSAVDSVNSSLTQISTLTITRTENSYYNATSISRLSAYKKNGMLFINGNLGNSTAIPALADFIEIGRISGWGAVDSIMTNIPSQGDGTKILNVLITATGIIRIFTGTGIPANAWTRFGLTVPSNL